MSLIEVLVAMLVVSMGVLAVAGLMATASRYGKTSEFRAVATLLASDIVDRIRANKPAIDPALAGDVAAYNMTGGYDSWATEPGDAADCANSEICLASEIVAQDRAEWGQAVFNSLPGGAAYVQLPADPKANPTADVWIAWLDPDASSDEATADVDGRSECPQGFRELTPQPRCAYFRVGL
ncbi:MAG TPA: type IV pilus modification protein PilV [Ideonella sp.]|nr:type IV pilus modification protein PilV [Ideonella sp.]HEX5686456.1 type IV pilus modification protein PilV [Ideonella sp.]